MVKETMVNEEKKTVWVRFTSWLATSWLGKAWNWLFGGNDASKANAAKPNGGTPTQSQGEGKGHAPQQGPQAPEGQGTGQPEGKTPTQSQVPEKNIGKICENGIAGLVLSLEDKNYNILEYHENSANSKEFYVLIECGDKKFLVTGRLEGAYYIINSVANQDGSNVSGDLKTMKNLLGLNGDTKEVKVTMSDVPSKAEVANPEPAANGKAPSSTSADPKQQHVAGNGPKK